MESWCEWAYAMGDVGKWRHTTGESIPKAGTKGWHLYTCNFVISAPWKTDTGSLLTHPNIDQICP
jgi:hypothetical protein